MTFAVFSVLATVLGLTSANVVLPYVYSYGVIPQTYSAVIPQTNAAIIPQTYTGLEFRSTPSIIPQYTPSVIVPHTGVVPQAYTAVEQTVPAVEPVNVIRSPFVPVPSTLHKFHTQNADGSYSFGYSGGPSSRFETRDRLGTVSGAFNYIDPTGKLQTQQYVSDSAGFRVAGTNLPIAPVVTQVAPQPVDYTPEVKAARAAFANAFSNKDAIVETKTRTKRNVVNVIPGSNTIAFQTPANTNPFYTVPTFRSILPVTYSVPSMYSSPAIHNVVPTAYNAVQSVPTSNAFPAVYRIQSTAHSSVPVVNVRPEMVYTKPRRAFSYEVIA